MGKSKSKSKSRPTTSRRNRKQKVRKQYANAREEAQLLGIIETTPEGAVRNERVSPGSQSEPAMAHLVVRAVRNGWATPDEKKPVIVDSLIGVVESDDSSDFDRVQAARVLAQVDRDQWERDNPELSGAAKGGTKVGIVNQNSQQQSTQAVVTGEDVLRTVLSLRGRDGKEDEVERAIAEVGLSGVQVGETK